MERPTTGRGSQTNIPDYMPIAWNAPKKAPEKLYGVGIVGDSPTHDTDGNELGSFHVWRAMLERCYDPIVHKRVPNYIGCSVDSRWHEYKHFIEWFNIHHVSGYELDKDIIQPGNKVYGPDTAAFVPAYINQCARRWTKPKSGFQGVTEFAGSYHASLTHKGKASQGQIFDNGLDAHIEWQLMKADSIDDHLTDYLNEPRPVLAVVRSLVRYADLLRRNASARIISLAFAH